MEPPVIRLSTVTRPPRCQGRLEHPLRHPPGFLTSNPLLPRNILTAPLVASLHPHITVNLNPAPHYNPRLAT